MIHTIKTRTHGTVTFFMNGDGGYVYLETANRSGTLGKQICVGGDFTGSTISATPETFAKVCRKWHKQRLAACAEYDMPYA